MVEIIDLHDWEVTADDFEDWCIESEASVFAIIHHGANSRILSYGFENMEDFLASQLRFPKKNIIYRELIIKVK
jgi:hypothetical protein